MGGCHQPVIECETFPPRHAARIGKFIFGFRSPTNEVSQTAYPTVCGWRVPITPGAKLRFLLQGRLPASKTVTSILALLGGRRLQEGFLHDELQLWRNGGAGVDCPPTASTIA